jgi:two-component system chemotaxis sensor kinase CheA
MFSGNTILGDGSVIMILDPNGIARATGVGAGDQRMPDGRPGAHHAGGADGGKALAAQSSDRTAMLLFRAGGQEPKAVPLGLVARLEDIPRDKIELSAGQAVTQYRGRLMPLVAMSGTLDPERPRHAVLVFTDADRTLGRDRCMGLVVDEIVDVVEDRLHVELAGDRPGLLGTAVIAGHATDVIDTSYWLQQAFHDWFGAAATTTAARVLIVEDSGFFRQLLVPALAAAGYEVTAAESAEHALRLRDAGVMFDVIVSDIEMPGMDGVAFVRRLRAEGPWSGLPVIALTGHVAAGQIELGRDAGFSDYVQKFERDALFASLRQCLAARVAAPMAA